MCPRIFVSIEKSTYQNATISFLSFSISIESVHIFLPNAHTRNRLKTRNIPHSSTILQYPINTQRRTPSTIYFMNIWQQITATKRLSIYRREKIKGEKKVLENTKRVAKLKTDRALLLIYMRISIMKQGFLRFP